MATGIALLGVLLASGCATVIEGCGDLTDCSGVCADLAEDVEHCGACGNACDPGEVCDGSGQCSRTCQADRVLCDGRCIDPRTSQAFCGATAGCSGDGAGESCGAGALCVAGRCETSCPAGFVPCGDRCVDPNVSLSFCGASRDCAGTFAGVTCAPGQVCADGTCGLECPAGFLNCGGVCTDPTISNGFCGATGGCRNEESGVRCDVGTVCSNGVCQENCAAGSILCGGRCVDPLSDNFFCGAVGACEGGDAGTVCEAGTICAAGECAVSCQPGFVECGGRCIDPMTSNTFCGASGTCEGDDAGDACGEGLLCGRGVCDVSCPVGFVECAGRCIDPLSNNAFCGAAEGCVAPNAGAECSDAEICSAGTCATSCQPGLVACAGRCVDPDFDRNFCGARGSCEGRAAGSVCGVGQDCQDGECSALCAPGFVLCGGLCVDPDSDASFCGATGDCEGANAGEACGSFQGCVDGECTGSALFAVAVFDPTNQGSWSATGSHTATDDTTPVGNVGATERRSYYSYDLTGLSGTAVTRAVLRLQLRSYSSTATTEDVGFFDVSTAARTLENSGTGQTAIFDDLGTGSRYGTLRVDAMDVLEVFEIELSADARDDIFDAFGDDFSIGLRLDTLGAAPNELVRFSFGAFQPEQLVIEYTPRP